MTIDSRSFRHTIGTVDGRKATMHIGAKRVMGNMQCLEIISCVSLERLNADEPLLWLGSGSHIIVAAADAHRSTIRDEHPAMIDEEIVSHFRWWTSAVEGYVPTDADETKSLVRQREILDRQLQEAIERVKNKLEW